MSEFVVTLQQELQRLEEELAELAEELATVRRQAEEHTTALEERRGQLQARARHIGALLTLEGVASYADVANSQVIQEGALNGNEGAHGGLAEAVYQLLAETGQEFHYRQLVATLQEKGIKVPGRDPGINLVAHIHDDIRFVRPARGVYALREWYPTLMKSVGTRNTKSKRRRLVKARSRHS